MKQENGFAPIPNPNLLSRANSWVNSKVLNLAQRYAGHQTLNVENGGAHTGHATAFIENMQNGMSPLAAEKAAVERLGLKTNLAKTIGGTVVEFVSRGFREGTEKKGISGRRLTYTVLTACGLLVPLCNEGQVTIHVDSNGCTKETRTGFVR